MITYAHPNRVSHNFMYSLARDFSINRGLLYDFYGIACHPGLDLVRGRNELARTVLKHVDQGVEWMLMIDTDIGWPINTISKIVDMADPLSRPVIGGVYRVPYMDDDGYGGHKIRNWVDMAMKFEERGNLSSYAEYNWHPGIPHLARVEAVGAGFLLVHRSVLAIEALHGKWFSIKEIERGPMGEDISFCYRLKDLGIPLWGAFQLGLTHHKEIWV